MFYNVSIFAQLKKEVADIDSEVATRKTKSQAVVKEEKPDDENPVVTRFSIRQRAFTSAVSSHREKRFGQINNVVIKTERSDSEPEADARVIKEEPREDDWIESAPKRRIKGKLARAANNRRAGAHARSIKSEGGDQAVVKQESESTSTGFEQLKDFTSEDVGYDEANDFSNAILQLDINITGGSFSYFPNE
ncbi:hypothetical protein COOONC_09175 [Cooperia oncophora]